MISGDVVTTVLTLCFKMDLKFQILNILDTLELLDNVKCKKHVSKC